MSDIRLGLMDAVAEIGQLCIQLAAAEAERDELRAELADERDRGDRIAAEAEKLRQELVEWVNHWRNRDLKAVTAERDALRVLLELSRPYVGQADGLLADRIDAALKASPSHP